MPKLPKLSAFTKGRLGHGVGPSREDVRKGLSYPFTSASTMLILGYLEVLNHQVVPDWWFEVGWGVIGLSIVIGFSTYSAPMKEPRESAQWAAHMKDMKEYSLRLAVAVRDHRSLWDEDIRDSLAVHFPEKAQRLDAYQQALDARSAAEVDLKGYCIQETPRLNIANVRGQITDFLITWGTQFADGQDPTQEAHASLGGSDSLRAKRGNKDIKQEEFHEWLAGFLEELRESEQVLDLGAAGRALKAATISAGNVYNDLKTKHHVPGPRCDLCRDYPA